MWEMERVRKMSLLHGIWKSFVALMTKQFAGYTFGSWLL